MCGWCSMNPSAPRSYVLPSSFRTRLTLFVITLVLSLSSVTARKSVAEQQEHQTPRSYSFMPELTDGYSLDGRGYGRSSIFNLAYRSIFSETIPETIFLKSDVRSFYGSSSTSGSYPYQERAVFKKKYPYFYPFIFLDNDPLPPNFTTVNKWAKPAVISFALTRDGTNPFMEGERNRQTQLIRVLEPFLPRIKETVDEINKTLEPLVGSKILHLDEGNLEYRRQKDFGHIHVLFFSDRKHFDTNKSVKRETNVEHRYIGGPSQRKKQEVFLDFDKHLNYAIAFSPDSEKQVEGKFFVNEKNEIQLSVCYIPTFISQEKVELLIDECLLRSLGVPDPITNWVYAPDPPNIPLLSYWNDMDKWSYQRRLRDDAGKLSATGITTLDLLILKILYNPKVYTGMSIRNFYQLFTVRE